MSNQTAETPITEVSLAALLESKDAAMAAFSQAGVESRKAADDKAPMSERLRLDIDYRVALTAFCAADKAYDDAIAAYVKAQKVAA